MDELAFSDATGLVHRLARRELSSVELLEHFVGRMERYNPAINAIVITRLDEAMAEAKAADAALAKGDTPGPLHGLPMTVKESFNLTGLPTTWGDPAYKDSRSQFDAVACERLRQAGAVIFGKTNVPLMLADFQSYNDIYGVTSNPYDLTRTPGGSSGGSAAAVAAGLTSFEVGSDIGGSIRNPAHFCGVFGHKPTWGILPSRGNALPGIVTPADLSVIGPLARSARDLRLVLDVVGGADELHRPGWELVLPQPGPRHLGEWRVAVWPDDPMAPVDDMVKARVLAVASLIEKAGGQVDYDARPEFPADFINELYQYLLHAALSARQPESMFTRALDRVAALDPDDSSATARVLRASTQYYREWHGRNEMRNQLRWSWHSFFEDYDVLLAPICVTDAFPHDHNPRMSERTVLVNGDTRPMFEQGFWAGLASVSYLPATVFPTGLDARGLPVGVQAITREMGDLTSIAFAEQISQVMGPFIPPENYRD